MSPDGISPPRPTPEERLLRLIRGSPPPAAKSAGPAPAAPARPASRPPMTHRWAWLAAAALSAVLVVEIVILLVQWLRPLPDVADMPAASSPVAAPPEEAGVADIPSVAASAGRPLFASPAVDEAQAQGGLPGTAARELAGRLAVTGIVEGDPPQAIIEDTQTHRTFFATQGQSVVDGAVLERVLSDRVILKWQGERIELLL